MKLERFFGYLNSIAWGQFVLVTEKDGVYLFGEGNEGPHVEITIHDTRFLRRLPINPAIILGESYVAGQWDVSKGRLAELFGIISVHTQRRPKSGFLLRGLSKLHRTSFRSNNPSVAQQVTQHHYDRGDQIFRLFLDPSLTYSCGYALSASDSLEQMQRQKYQLICQKLGLEESASVIDLGCGWGGFLLHVARQFPNVDAVGVTTSKNQFDYVVAQINAEQLANRLRVECRDFRHTPDKQHDFLVSVGMFEHLGRGDYSAFMKKVSRLLKRGGRGLLHTMATLDEVSEQPDPWISKYIFPRHRLPRLDEMVGEMRRNGLHIGHIENLRPHYAETFRRWGENFSANQETVLKVTGDKKFYRMWDYYLNLCEAGFRYGSMELYQILFSNGRWAFPDRFEFGLRPSVNYSTQVIGT